MPISLTSDQAIPEPIQTWFTIAQNQKPSLNIKVHCGHAQLHIQEQNQALPDLRISFTDTLHHHLIKTLSRKQPLWRALQWKNTSSSPVIFDTTAGFGQDSFIFAHLGARVISIEKAPLIAAILGYAVWVLQKEKPDLSWEVQYSDSKSWLQKPPIPPTHIYLDPFFHKKNSAKPKNTMQWLQFITQEQQPCPEELFQQANGMQCSHIIVKRAKEAPFINNQKPDRGSIFQKASRFDCYSPRSRT